MGGLSSLPNIGAKVEEQLNRVGILSYEDLSEIGAKKAWLEIQKIDETACINRLMALEGAVQGVKKNDLPPACKEDLKDFYREHKIL